MSDVCYCDYDPPEFSSRRICVARKAHKCTECRGPIQPGEKYEYVAGRWEGEFCDFHTCERCVDLRQWVMNNVPCFCWAHGDMTQNATEAIEAATYRAPKETAGLYFGFLRRLVLRDRHNKAANADDRS